jgi:alpha-glucosidase (family GH31 glycosyl hydrolase)
MYPEINPLIRDTIKRRYEMIPYLYSLMLESNATASPPQRWIGSGYESDPEVWTPELMAGETQYWLGGTILVGGVYEPGKTTARMYLPTKGHDDQGYINLNTPYQYLSAGQWAEIKSEWRDSIPLLARVGGGVVVGKNIQTRSPGDHRFPSHNVVEDDYRAVEIFPSGGNSGKTYSYTWYEDDGISAQPDVSTFTLRYSSSSEQVLVEFEKAGNFLPPWKNLDIILPVGDARIVVVSGSGVACERAKESRGRHVFTMSTA